MLLAVAVVPLATVLVLTVLMRCPAHIAAWLGVGVTAALALAVPAFSLPSAATVGSATEAALLVADAALVIVPGLYLNELLARRQVHQRLADWVRSLPMPVTDKVAVVVVGFGPALESLTGFGVSLLLTVPVLLALTDRPTALRQSALSLNIMPWGTLGLATVVAGALSKQPIADVGRVSSLISAAIFPVFGALATSLLVTSIDGKRARVRAAAAGAGVGTVFATCLVLCNLLGVVRPAGVLSGLAAGLIGMWVLRRRGQRTPAPPRDAVAPYAMALGLVGLVQVALLAGVELERFAVQAGRIEFAPLTSPGLPLFITALSLQAGRIAGPAVWKALGRSRKVLTALLGFTLMAQLMSVAGMVGVLGGVLATSGLLGAILLSPAFGVLSGFLTGSNTGGNALMAGVQSAAGAELGSPLAATAVQNSAAGHAVFASLPETLLVLAVAGDSDKKEESALLRFNLRVLGLVYGLLVAATAAVWLL